MGQESTFQELKKTEGFFEICFDSSNVKTVCKGVANKKMKIPRTQRWLKEINIQRGQNNPVVPFDHSSQLP